jgi:hypothetical protein
VLDENEVEFTPCDTPFINQSINGVVPGLLREAVKFTLVPAQIWLDDAEMLIPLETTSFTTILITFELDVGEVIQVEELDITTSILSPLLKLDVIKTAEFVPTFIPFLLH